MYDLNGKIALVTGAATGIGLEYVKELLRNGVRGITIVDIDGIKGEKCVKELARQFGNSKVQFIKTDVTKADQMEAAFKMCMDTWKTIDIVINNAGILNENRWELEIMINCNSVVRGTLLAMQYLGKDKGGNGGIVVNVASILGLQPFASCSVYTATKHFVVGFSRSMGSSYHYNRTGIKVLTMCPGVTSTSLIAVTDDHALTTLSPDIVQQMKKEVGALPNQTADNVARGMITLITKGDNGSVWVSEGNEAVYECHIPDRHTFRKF